MFRPRRVARAARALVLAVVCCAALSAVAGSAVAMPIRDGGHRIEPAVQSGPSVRAGDDPATRVPSASSRPSVPAPSVHTVVDRGDQTLAIALAASALGLGLLAVGMGRAKRLPWPLRSH